MGLQRRKTDQELEKEIRDMKSRGMTLKAIAAEYGDQSLFGTVGRILKGDRVKSVELRKRFNLRISPEIKPFSMRLRNAGVDDQDSVIIERISHVLSYLQDKRSQ